MDLKSTIQNDLKTAMKAQDSLKLNALRMVIAEIKKREIDKRSALDDTEIQKAISTLAKQRQESIEAFTKGGRTDLADKESKELALLKSYLPDQLSREEVLKIVESVIQESGAKTLQDQGKVMKGVLAKAQGKADGKVVNEIVREKLGHSPS